MNDKMTKKIVPFLAVLFLCASAYGQKAPALEAVSSPWDFGSVKKGAIKEKTFILRNAGGGRTVLENVSSCCGYSVMDVSSWEIDPGKTSEIKVSCDTARKEVGKDENKVTVRSNDPANPVLEIPVTATVTP